MCFVMSCDDSNVFCDVFIVSYGDLIYDVLWCFISFMFDRTPWRNLNDSYEGWSWWYEGRNLVDDTGLTKYDWVYLSSCPVKCCATLAFCSRSTLWFHQTWQWQIPELNGGFNRNNTFEWSIFHCHVWLPEGTFWNMNLSLWQDA